MPLKGNVILGGVRMAKNLSKAGRKRIPMTSKMGNKNFYKGKGSTKEGHITSKGRFVTDPSRRLEIIAPDLTDFKLKPYVTKALRYGKGGGSDPS